MDEPRKRSDNQRLHILSLTSNMPVSDRKGNGLYDSETGLGKLFARKKVTQNSSFKQCVNSVWPQSFPP